MIASLIGEIFRGVLGIVGDKIKSRSEIEKAKTDATIKRIERDQQAGHDWDKLMADGSRHSWKDEFWTLVLAWPFIAAFIPIQAVQDAVVMGFHNIENSPDWWKAAVGLAIGAAFGYRKFVDYMGRRK